MIVVVGVVACSFFFRFRFENNEQTESSSIHCFRIGFFDQRKRHDETKTIHGLFYPVTDKKEPKIGKKQFRELNQRALDRLIRQLTDCWDTRCLTPN